MQDWQQRVINEKAELDERLTKLAAFIESPAFGALEAFDAGLMLNQREAMEHLSRILASRIERFK